MKRPAFVIATTSAAVTVSLGVLAFLSLIRSPHIPTTIGDDEYRVYSDWATFHFSKHPSRVPIYIMSRTFKFNPLELPNACSYAAILKAGVPGSLLRQLVELGDAEYVFKDNPPVALRLMWKYKLADSSPDLPPGAFHLLAFSRVALSRDRRQALFAVSDACAGGDCGKGAAVYVHKAGETWKFESTGCVWLY